MYDHEKIQRKMDNLEDLDNAMNIAGSTEHSSVSTYKSINYKH